VPGPLLLAVDGNSLLHRAHHAMSQGELRDPGGRPVWAIKGLISFVATAAARLTPDAVVIGFDCPFGLFRKDEYPGYKAQRAPKPDDLVEQLEDAPRLLADAGFCVVMHDGHEADDVLASSAAMAKQHGWRTAVVTSDRDSFALIDEHTSVLRVLNGGIDGAPLLTPEKLRAVCGVSADQYTDFAALRGDTSDNLPGAHGIGGKTAAKLLAVFGGVDEAYAALDNGREEEVVAAIGKGATERLAAAEARANVARNQKLMTMRDDLRLPALARMRVPLDHAAMRGVLGAREINLNQSLWALTGQDPPAWYGERAYGVPSILESYAMREPSERRVVTLPKPLSRAAKKAAALSDAGQMSLF
jgi:DNA polymerase-1